MERSWSLWGRHVGARRPPKHWKTYYFVQIHFFEDKTVRRGFRQPLKRKEAPRGAKMTPKRDPRSTPKRPKTDIKIDQISMRKSRGLYRDRGADFGPGTPPREPPPCARYTSIQLYWVHIPFVMGTYTLGNGYIYPL